MVELERAASNGLPLTEEIIPPDRNEAGQIVTRPDPRREGKRIAVRSGAARANPLTRFVRVHSARDLTKALALDPDDRRARYKAMLAWQAVAADGHFELVKVRGGYKLFGPAPAPDSSA